MPPATPSRAARVARPAAYRHLVLTILGLDVPTLAAQLRTSRTTRLAPARPVSQLARRAA
jgi:hypothetical protein